MLDNRKKKYLWIDPPEGWRYGFPKGLPEGFAGTDDEIRKFLFENGYPSGQIELALRRSRMGFEYIYEDDGSENG